MRKKRWNQAGNDQGFSLIELSISLMVVGILIGAGLAMVHVWIEKGKLERTVQNVDKVTLLLAGFRSTNGYFPCPAPIVDRDHAMYGRSADCTDESVAPGSNLDGVYIAQSQRPPLTIDIDSDGVVEAHETNYVPRIRIGMVPFRTLNYAEESVHDGYGSKIYYAVTEELAQEFPYVAQAGGITVVDENDISLVNPEHSVDFFVFSSGMDRRGGYTFDGTLFGGLGCDATTLDGENCDLDDPIFRVAAYTKRPGVGNHFDDIARYQVPMTVPLWARSSEPGHEHDIYALRLNGAIGSDYTYNNHTVTNGADAYGTNTKLFVNGNILTHDVSADPDHEDGRIYSDNFCDRFNSADPTAEATDCFNPAILNSVQGTYDCSASNQFMVGIQNNNIICGNPTGTVEACGGNQVAAGFSDGALNCDPIPCMAKNVTTCVSNHVLPASPHGTSITVAGGENNCQQDSYQCNDGVWTLTSSGGPWGADSCTCPAILDEFTTAGCGVCMTGQYNYQRTADCATCSWSAWVETSNDCAPDLVTPACIDPPDDAVDADDAADDAADPGDDAGVDGADDADVGVEADDGSAPDDDEGGSMGDVG